jgi:hypothetical protein
LPPSEISSRPLVRFARRDVRAHIVSHKDHGPLQRHYGALPW